MKNRRGSVLCRCTWYNRQPGSLRDSSVSFENTPTTSASRPTFAIHVTASTTIARSVLDFSLPCSQSGQLLKFCCKLIQEYGFLTPRSGGDHADACSALPLDEG